MAFENLYPKFRVYPYIFETEEVAPLADYEAIFDTMPALSRHQYPSPRFIVLKRSCLYPGYLQT